jgi:hypothetical protein
LLLALGCEAPTSKPAELAPTPVQPRTAPPRPPDSTTAEVPADAIQQRRTAKLVSEERKRIEKRFVRGLPIAFCGYDWAAFSDQEHSDLERSALQSIVDQPAGHQDRGCALSALTHDAVPALWDYWAGFEKRADFTDADVYDVIAGLRAARPKEAVGFIGARLDRLAWARVVVRALEGIPESERALWPVPTPARLEQLARDPAMGADRARAWCVLFRAAPGEDAIRWRDELLGGTDASLRAAAVRCGPALPHRALEALAGRDGPVGAAAADRYFDARDAADPIDLATVARLAAGPPRELRTRAEDHLRAKLKLELDTSQMSGLRIAAADDQIRAFLAAVKREPALMEHSVTVASLAGQHWELRGEVGLATQAYQHARSAAAHAGELSGMAPCDLAQALFQLARLQFTAGQTQAARATAQELAASTAGYCVGSPFPVRVFDGDGTEVSKALLARYAGWLEFEVQPASDRRSVRLRVRNRDHRAHVLHLSAPEWPTSATAVPRYISAWVGGEEIDTFSSQHGVPQKPLTLAPGASWALSLPINLSTQKRPFKLAVAMDLDVDGVADVWRTEALRFVR